MSDDVIDPNSDEELAETPTAILRQYLRYWKWEKSEKHHLERTGERVDRRRQVERITAVISTRDDRGPGRPLGHRLSDQTRSSISYARREWKLTKELTTGRGGPDEGGSWPSPPPCDDPRVTLEVRLGAAIRDNYQCSGCHEYYRIRYWKRPGDKKKYWAEVKDARLVIEVQHQQDIRCWLVPHGDPQDSDHVLLLCSFCRDTAVTGGLKMLGVTVELDRED